MDILKEIISNLPLNKLTSYGVLIVAIAVIIAVIVITHLKRNDTELKIESTNTKINKTKIGNISNSKEKKKIDIKLEDSEIDNSEIGCVINEKK